MLLQEERTYKKRGRHCKNLDGQRFGRLVALELTEERASDGSRRWLCRCDCGKLTKVSSSQLLQGKTTSCGCIAIERLKSSRTFLGGTCLEIIRSKKINKNNTSGIRGVSRNRGAWLAKISFAGRQFYLGRYADKQRAADMIREAEDIRSEILDDIETLGDSAVEVFAHRLRDMMRSR